MWRLGPIMGYRYYRMNCWANENPELLLEWAKGCDREAVKLEFKDPDSKDAEIFRLWAKELRECYEKLPPEYKAEKLEDEI